MSDWTIRERVDLYVERGDELLRCRVLAGRNHEPQLSLRFERGLLSAAVSQPDEDDLKAFLVTFRHFISKSEPVFVNAIHGLLWRNIEADAVRSGLKESQQVWRQSCKAGAIALSINDTTIDSELILDCWINGIYFHNDRRKRAAVESWGSVEGVVARYKLLDHLVVATSYISYLRNVIVRGRADGLLRC